MKVAFFYTVGTSYLINIFPQGINRSPLFTAAPSVNRAVVAGLNGATAVWDGGPPGDPFPTLLDPNIFDCYKIGYLAAAVPMNVSIDDGVSRVIAAINGLPAGQPFCLGGYSQGAAVMSVAARQGLLPGTSGALSGRAGDFLGAVTFGNPMRATNHRGAIGGSWSGGWDIPGSTTGGHGSFPLDGPYPRMSWAPDNWVDFAYPGEVINSTGDSDLGQRWSYANGIFTNGNPLVFFANILNLPVWLAVKEAFDFAGQSLTFVGGDGVSFNWLTGMGHTAYAFMPPFDIGGTKTMYQLALEWLTGLANQFAVSPILVGANSGWSTTLIPPA